MNVDADTVPMSLKVAAILLAASGAMALVAGMVGPILGRAWCKQARAVRLRNWATGISSTRSLSLRCRLAYGADGRGRGGVVFCYWGCRFAGRCSPCQRAPTSARPWEQGDLRDHFLCDRVYLGSLVVCAAETFPMD
jgi:hypothetical protein